MGLINLSECEVLDIVSQQVGFKMSRALKVRRLSFLNLAIAGAQTLNTYSEFEQGQIDQNKGVPPDYFLSRPLYWGDLSVQVGLANPSLATPTSPDYYVQVDQPVITGNDGVSWVNNELGIILYGDGSFNGSPLPAIGDFDFIGYGNQHIQVLAPFLPINIELAGALPAVFTRFKFYFEGWQLEST